MPKRKPASQPREGAGVGFPTRDPRSPACDCFCPLSLFSPSLVRPRRSVLKRAAAEAEEQLEHLREDLRAVASKQRQYRKALAAKHERGCEEAAKRATQTAQLAHAAELAAREASHQQEVRRLREALAAGAPSAAAQAHYRAAWHRETQKNEDQPKI